MKPLITAILLSLTFNALAAKTITVNLKGDFCSSCVSSLESKLKSHSAVESVSIDLTNKKAIISYKEGKSLTNNELSEIFINSESN